MFSKESWINNSATVFSAWSGSTVFTWATLWSQLTGDANFFTIIVWILTTSLAVLSGYSRWRLNLAEEQERLSEARKNNAEAAKIEFEVSDDYKRTVAEKCDEDCLYKDLYAKLSPLLNKKDLSANNNIFT